MHESSRKKRLVVGISGASGAILGIRLLEAMRADFLVDGQPRQVSASIGIAWSAHPEHGALAHAADEALYQSKRAGRNTASVLVAGAGS